MTDLNRNDRNHLLLSLLEFATDLDQTSEEAKAELRADGVDVDAFLAHVHRVAQKYNRPVTRLADVSDPFARMLHKHCGPVEYRYPSSRYPGRLTCDSFFLFVVEESSSDLELSTWKSHV